MYIANHYVRVGRKMYKPGEEIPENIPSDKLDWLITAGAVREFTPAAPAAAPQEEEPQQTIEEPEEAPEEEGAEADDDAEAPEIDAMAGIVQGGPEEEPKKPARAKSTAKKTTGRRKSG